MSRPVWFVNFLKKIYPARHGMAKLTKVPIIGELVDYFVFMGDDMLIIPKDKTIHVDAPLASPESTIIPSQVVDHFINRADYHFIMDFCICREGDDCQDFPQKFGCLFLGEPVLKINSKLGRLVTEEEALEYVQRCREAGLIHNIGRNRLDTIWLGTSPVEELMTICNCCPCCCLWGLVTDLTPKISDKVARMPGVQVEVTDLCQGCETCSNGICFAEAIQVENGRAVISLECRGCGRCVEICPEEAIQLTIEGEKNIEEAIARLNLLVDF